MQEPRYSPWTRRLHWLVFVLVAGALAMIFLHGAAPKGSELRANLKWAHFQFGLSVLLVMVPRLILFIRRRGAHLPITPPPPAWQVLTAKLVHALLYLLLFVTPITGAVTMKAKGKPWNFLGLPMPVWSPPDPEFSKRIEEVHENLGNLLMYLAILHAGIALAHHFLRRDDALRHMLPPSRPERSSPPADK